jgi:hypothetical protein
MTFEGEGKGIFFTVTCEDLTIVGSGEVAGLGRSDSTCLTLTGVGGSGLGWVSSLDG